MFQNRTQAERREKGQRAHNQNHRNQQHGEKRRRDGERACGLGHQLLAGEAPGDRQNGDVGNKAAQECGEAGRGVVPEGVRIDPGECRSVVAGGRRKGIQNL